MAAYYSLQINGNPSAQNKFSASGVFPHKPLLCHVPLKITMMSQDQQPSYCQSIRADIEAHLRQAIPLKAPLSVFEPMRHLAFSAPPNTAPALCVAACELVGGRRSQAMAAAAALHLMHAASFAHENLPLTDRPKPNSRPRPNFKPKPAAHHAYGPNIELLIPDAMVPFGFELLARSDDPDQTGSDRVLRVITEMARVGGSQGGINAQYQEIVVGQPDSATGGDSCDDEWLNETCRRKEGALHACAAACGAILGGASEEDIDKLRNYGLYVGMIQGYSNRLQTKAKELDTVVELTNLALNQLQHFQGRKTEAISSFINVR